MSGDSQSKAPRLVGAFIRQRRESLGLSQKSLGLLFSPSVTTQFISNVERGVTPLPPAHIPTLARALQVPEAELLRILEKEYTAKLSGRMKRPADDGAAFGAGADLAPLIVSEPHLSFMQSLYDAYRKADEQTQRQFASVCQNLLKLAKQSE